MDYAIGVDVGGTKILAALAACGREAKIVERVRLSTEAQGEGRVLERIGGAIDLVLERGRVPLSALSGIGLAFPGVVSPEKGIVVECPNIPSLDRKDVRAYFQDRFRLPVAIANDAHAAALAEARNGAGRVYDNFIYISLGTGIGCGIIIGGELYRGADGAAGELSHVVFPDQGSLHNLASGKALRTRFGIECENLGELCEAGDARGREALGQLVRYIGLGIANMVTLLNPQAVVLGGGLSRLGPLFLGPLEEEIRRTAFSIGARTFALATAEHAEDAGALGAVFVHLDGARA